MLPFGWWSVLPISKLSTLDLSSLHQQSSKKRKIKEGLSTRFKPQKNDRLPAPFLVACPVFSRRYEKNYKIIKIQNVEEHDIPTLAFDFLGQERNTLVSVQEQHAKASTSVTTCNSPCETSRSLFKGWDAMKNLKLISGNFYQLLQAAFHTKGGDYGGWQTSQLSRNLSLLAVTSLSWPLCSFLPCTIAAASVIPIRCMIHETHRPAR